jgi:hypothetical protein
MKVFVIEYLENKMRADRKQFWKGLEASFRNDIDIIRCPQKRHGYFLATENGEPFPLSGYDIIFIHESDQDYNRASDYLELAGKEGLPYVCYSDGAVSVIAPNLKKLQIQKMPLSLLKANIRTFFEKLKNTEKPSLDSFYSLVGLDLRLEAAIELLEIFLPLDIELQLHQVDKCRDIGGKLLNRRQDVIHLLNSIYTDFQITLEVLESTNSEEESGYGLLCRLWDYCNRLQNAQTKEELKEIFLGKAVKAEYMHNDLDDLTMYDNGFHRTYEKLRDNLFAQLEERM